MNVLEEAALSTYSKIIGITENECKDEYIKQAIQQLDVFERTCLLLQIDGEFTVQDIADIVKKSDEEVNNSIVNAKRLIREFYLFLDENSKKKANTSTVTRHWPMTTNDIDACIICALSEEADTFMRTLAFHNNVVFEKAFSKRSKREYRYASIQNNSGEQLNLLVSWPPDYGAVETSLHLQSLLKEYKPRFVAMTGICAGDQRKVKLGDIIVADRTFTYDNSKFVRDDNRLVYMHDTDTSYTDPTVLQSVRMFDAWKSSVAAIPRPCSKRQQREWLLGQLLEEATLHVDDIPVEMLNKNAPGWRKIVRELQEKPYFYLTKDRMLRDRSKVAELFYNEEIFPFKDPELPECHIAPMASGSVIHSDDPFDTIRIPVRGTVGIDMEGCTFHKTLVDFPGIHSLLAKGVADYADREKDDEYHIYAAQIAALYVLSFIKEYVTSDLMPKHRQSAWQGSISANVDTTTR